MRHHRKRCLRCGRDLPVIQAPKPAGPTPWYRAHWRHLAIAGGLLFLIGLAAAGLGRRAAIPVAAPVAAAAPAAVVAAAPAVPAVFPAVAPLADPDAMGHVAYRGGDFQAAFDRYKDAADRNPSDAEASSNAGQMLVRLGRPAEAVPYFERAIALNGARWAFHFNLAHASGRLGQWDRALAEYEAAAALFPDDHVTEYNLGMALHKRGDEAAAVGHYRRAIELEPNEADFQLSLGISSERLGRVPDAIGAYTRYLEMAPTSPEAGKVRARVDALAKTAPAPAAPPPAAPAKSGPS